ncbi:MAG: phospho-N-acetylmuramoyl-pentapeptide-transferase [bacterium]|nr:phospho-N-acetylmuramoyl-pentapeptide-transferase [bacterium]
MLYNFLFPYHSQVSFLNVLRYPSFRMVMAALTALLITLFVFPWFIKRLQIFKFGQAIREDGPKDHYKKQGTPTLGGVLILFAITISTLLWADLTHVGIWLILLVTLGYGLIGFYDDYKKIKFKNPKGLSGRWKLFWQAIIGITALLIYSMNFSSMPFSTELVLPFVSVDKFHPELPTWLYLLFALFLLVGTSNAVNLTDGLDGLAIGPVIICAFVFLILAYAAGTTLADFNIAKYLKIPSVKGSSELSIFCAAIMGAGVGFLWYNVYPALVFMGDVGSLALGGALALLAVFTKNEILSALLLGGFLIEALSVILQVASYKLTGKRIFRMAPIHHHFELMGWPESRIIVRFWIFNALLALLALASLKLR